MSLGVEIVLGLEVEILLGLETEVLLKDLLLQHGPRSTLAHRDIAFQYLF